MASYAYRMRGLLCSLVVVAVVSMQKAAATATGDLTAPSPMASRDATTTVASEDILLQWLKITVVPLGVFLLGACTWGCIKNTILWRSLSGCRRESNVPVELPIVSSRDAHSDLEVGRQLSDLRNTDDDMAATSALALAVQHPPLESPNEEGENEPTDVAPKL